MICDAGEVRKTAVEKTTPLAEKAKDVAVSAGQTTLHYMEERAVKARDMTLEGGKTTATYASDVAVDLKDKVTVVGWTTVQYTTEAAVEETIKTAKVVMGAAEDARHKVVDIVSKPMGMAKDAAVVAGEKAGVHCQEEGGCTERKGGQKIGN
ncbi:seed biotin-containing protein SBP65-like [Pyrus ussuriensis x Pyrus communis]|uniref:Seed biotin-containing protein SBP65-like n=1 Tax=Pyrus ussuriensis x Pyrus communis TaxID=2448454 RepID=A0A5N5GPA8_9ROSA|nr:seed biotin-containing protein SBP65-like [Pyrus ussuriensis x Pyrus communis]